MLGTLPAEYGPNAERTCRAPRRKTDPSDSSMKASDLKVQAIRRVPGRPFVKNDPRACKHPPGRPPMGKAIPDLLRWCGAMKCPDQMAVELRKLFNLPANTPLTVEQATIMRARLEALKGSNQHLAFVAERTEGKAIDRLSVEGATMTIVETIIDGGSQTENNKAAPDAPAPGAKPTP